MAVWKVHRLGRVSSASGELLPPDTEIVTALFGDDEEVGEDRVRGSGFVRKDFLVEEATDEALQAAFCVWRTRTPPAKPEKARRFDLAMAREFLERLLTEGRDDRAAVCLTLALLLARKRRLTIIEQGADVIKARWPKSDEVFDVPAPIVTEAEAESLQQDLMRLFGMETAPPPEAAPSEEAPTEEAPGEPAEQATEETASKPADE